MNMKMKTVSLVLAGTLALGLTTNAGAVNATAFTDVRPNDWYYSAVNHVVERNYFNGVRADTFAPNQSMTRAMAVTVLSRMFGGDLSGCDGRTAFTDVPTDAYYAKAVQWAVEQGIASGTSPTTFSPDAYATREQISVFLYNAVRTFGDLGRFNGTALNKFSDRNRVSSWASIALQWATSNNIINGDNGQIKPQNSTTRAAFATIAMNYDSKHPASGTMPPLDPQPTPDEDTFVPSMEDELNHLLVSAWETSNAPTRDTDKLVQAARKIASGEMRDAEQALKNTGFNEPIGHVHYDKYFSNRYDAKSFLVTASSAQQAINSLKNQDSLMSTDAFTEYGVGVYKVNAIQFRAAVVTYNGVPHEDIDLQQIADDWLAEQAATPVRLSDLEQQVVDLTNNERAKYGLAPLKTSADLQKAAKVRAKEAAISYNHTRPNDQFAWTVYIDVGCSLYQISPITGKPVFCNQGCRENLGGGIYTPETVVSGWMDSPGHRANILATDITHIGVALEPRIKNGVQQGYYWVQCFLGP